MARDAANLNDIYAIPPDYRIWGERITVYADTDARNGVYEFVYGANSSRKTDNLNWVKITDSARAITSVVSIAAQDDINVDNGTVFADLPLPTTVRTTLDTGTITSVPIVWAQGSYDETIDATYTLTGTLDLSGQFSFISNPNTVTASIDVIVTTPPPP